MGNQLHKLVANTPLIGGQLAKKDIAWNAGFGSHPSAPPPAFDPSNAPGTHLFAPPGGAPPGGGGAPGSLFSGSPASNAGYAPNPYLAAGGGTPPVPMLAGSSPGYNTTGSTQTPNTPWLGRGGSSSGTPGAPPMANANQGPALQQQLAISQMLRRRAQPIGMGGNSG